MRPHRDSRATIREPVAVSHLPDSDQFSNDSLGLYLREIGRYPLLSAEEEVFLAQNIEEGTEAADHLALRQLTQEEALPLIEAGALARERLATSNLRLVVMLARRYGSHELPLLDIIQLGNVGLLNAVDRFDWRRGFRFSTHAAWWIRQAIGVGVEQTARVIRLPRQAREDLAKLRHELHRNEDEVDLATAAQKSGITAQRARTLLNYSDASVSIDHVPDDGRSLAEFLADVTADDPADSATTAMENRELRELFLNTLSARQREVLALRFGLNGGHPLTRRDIGRRVGLSHERVRQIETEAIEVLRLAATGLQAPL